MYNKVHLKGLLPIWTAICTTVVLDETADQKTSNAFSINYLLAVQYWFTIRVHHQASWSLGLSKGEKCS